MQTYISLLRGINVGGNKIIKMDELKRIYQELGFQEVQTYIQSGNVIFKTSRIDSENFTKEISDKITSIYNFDVVILQRTIEEWKDVLGKNPFADKINNNLDKILVVFLDKNPQEDFINKLKDINFTPDEYSILGKEMYLYCPNGYGKTKLANPFVESKLKVKASTRNWKTILEISKLINIK
jgi:uncharacterized protein (DUF1697 family)